MLAIAGISTSRAAHSDIPLPYICIFVSVRSCQLHEGRRFSVLYICYSTCMVRFDYSAFYYTSNGSKLGNRVMSCHCDFESLEALAVCLCNSEARGTYVLKYTGSPQGISLCLKFARKALIQFYLTVSSLRMDLMGPSQGSSRLLVCTQQSRAGQFSKTIHQTELRIHDPRSYTLLLCLVRCAPRTSPQFKTLNSKSPNPLLSLHAKYYTNRCNGSKHKAKLCPPISCLYKPLVSSIPRAPHLNLQTQDRGQSTHLLVVSLHPKRLPLPLIARLFLVMLTVSRFPFLILKIMQRSHGRRLGSARWSFR